VRATRVQVSQFTSTSQHYHNLGHGCPGTGIEHRGVAAGELRGPDDGELQPGLADARQAAKRQTATRHCSTRDRRAGREGDCYRRGITWGFSATGRHPKMSDNPTPLGRLTNSPRCGAKTRAGSTCRQPVMKNGRCRLHGGKSPGAPRGERNGNYRHGLPTIETAAQRRQAAEVRRELRRLLGALV
jgi:hypothetical protein